MARVTTAMQQQIPTVLQAVALLSDKTERDEDRCVLCHSFGCESDHIKATALIGATFGCCVCLSRRGDIPPPAG